MFLAIINCGRSFPYLDRVEHESTSTNCNKDRGRNKSSPRFVDSPFKLIHNPTLANIPAFEAPTKATMVVPATINAPIGKPVFSIGTAVVAFCTS